MVEFPQTPEDNKRGQKISLRFDPAKVIQPRCLNPSILTFTFHINPPPPLPLDVRHNLSNCTHPRHNYTYLSLTYPTQRE